MHVTINFKKKLRQKEGGWEFSKEGGMFLSRDINCVLGPTAIDLKGVHGVVTRDRRKTYKFIWKRGEGMSAIYVPKDLVSSFIVRE